MAAKKGTTVKQEEVSHHYDTAKAAIWQTTKEPPITHERLLRIYGERDERVNHKLDNLLLSRRNQVSISRLRSDHRPDLIYWHYNIGIVLGTVCRKCGM